MLVQPALMERKRFCSRACQGRSKIEHMNQTRRPAASNAGWFGRGAEPWNKGISVSLSPATQFKLGAKPVNVLPIGSERVRRDKNGKPRTWVKVAEPRVWKLRAVVNWEAIHGPVPQGQLLHHKDRDTLNDSDQNLEPLDRPSHLAEHRPEYEPRRKANALRAARRRRQTRDSPLAPA